MLNFFNREQNSYVTALLSGYVLMGAHMLTQIVLTPLYLKTLGEEQFGLLMIFLNIITFAVFGIAWFSGGLVRVLGEYWSSDNIKKFNDTLILGKYIFTSYSIAVSIFSIIIFLIIKNFGYLNNIEFTTILLISAYFILTYEALSERQAFVGANWQALGNFIELAKVLFLHYLQYFYYHFT